MAKHEWNAADYAKNSAAQQQWAIELIAKLALKGGESVLDVGCGDGKITAQIATTVSGGKVFGIDLSEDMIRLAKEHFPPDRYPNLSFRRMDATKIRLDEKFDVAFSNAALHWVKDQLAVLKGVRSCLKTGGKILFQFGGRGNADEILRLANESITAPRWARYYKNFIQPYWFRGPEEYEPWLKESGFQPMRVELIEKDMQHDSRDGLKGWIRTTWFPFTDPLPADLRETYIEEILEKYLASHPVDAQGRTHVKMVRLEVEAVAI